MARTIAMGIQNLGDLIQKNTFILIKHPLSKNGGKAGTV